MRSRIYMNWPRRTKMKEPGWRVWSNNNSRLISLIINQLKRRKLIKNPKIVIPYLMMLRNRRRSGYGRISITEWGLIRRSTMLSRGSLSVIQRSLIAKVRKHKLPKPASQRKKESNAVMPTKSSSISCSCLCVLGFGSYWQPESCLWWRVLLPTFLVQHLS